MAPGFVQVHTSRRFLAPALPVVAPALRPVTVAFSTLGSRLGDPIPTNGWAGWVVRWEGWRGDVDWRAVGCRWVGLGRAAFTLQGNSGWLTDTGIDTYWEVADPDHGCMEATSNISIAHKESWVEVHVHPTLHVNDAVVAHLLKAIWVWRGQRWSHYNGTAATICTQKIYTHTPRDIECTWLHRALHRMWMWQASYWTKINVESRP